jgi:rRNA maturation endonuclease Nob1
MSQETLRKELEIKCEKCKEIFPFYMPHGICDDCRKEMFKAKDKK